MLELNTYNRTLKSMLDKNSSSHLTEKGFLQPNANDLSWLADKINKSTTNRVFVRDLQVRKHFCLAMIDTYFLPSILSCLAKILSFMISKHCSASEYAFFFDTERVRLL